MADKKRVRVSVPLSQLTSEELQEVKRPRFKKILISSSGGNAGENSIQYKIGIPSFWAQILNITKDNKDVVLVLREDKKEIAIIPKEFYDSKE